MARRILGTFVAIGVFGPVWIWAQSGKAPVEGAWLLQEYSYTKPGATVAKSAANTTTGAFLEYTFTVTGDTLTMVNIGPSQNPRTWRLVRAK